MSSEKTKMSSEKTKMSARLLLFFKHFLLTKKCKQFIIYVIKGEKNMAEKIIGVYKITNTVTGDFYIGSSKNIKQRWAAHKCHSRWKKHPNNPMYLDMKKYGVDSFDFEVIAEAEESFLKEKEQKFIELLKPAYNSNNAKGLDVERRKERHKKTNNKYNNQLCLYNGKILTLNALSKRFQRAGITHPQLEAKKYLVL